MTEPFDQCAICLETITEPILPECGHFFCRDCFFKIKETKEQCPLCRRSLDKYERHAAFGAIPDQIDQPQSTQEADGYYDIIDIVGQRGRGKTIRYLVLWDTGETTWEPIDHLQKSQRVLKAYQRRNRAFNTRKWRAKKQLEQAQREAN